MFVQLLGASNTGVIKVDQSGSMIWIASFPFDPIIKSLSVDTTEEYVYFAGWVNQLSVLRLSTQNGGIINQYGL